MKDNNLLPQVRIALAVAAAVPERLFFRSGRTGKAPRGAILPGTTRALEFELVIILCPEGAYGCDAVADSLLVGPGGGSLYYLYVYAPGKER